MIIGTVFPSSMILEIMYFRSILQVAVEKGFVEDPHSIICISVWDSQWWLPRIVGLWLFRNESQFQSLPSLTRKLMKYFFNSPADVFSILQGMFGPWKKTVPEHIWKRLSLNLIVPVPDTMYSILWKSVSLKSSAYPVEQYWIPPEITSTWESLDTSPWKSKHSPNRLWIIQSELLDFDFDVKGWLNMGR